MPKHQEKQEQQLRYVGASVTQRCDTMTNMNLNMSDFIKHIVRVAAIKQQN